MINVILKNLCQKKPQTNEKALLRRRELEMGADNEVWVQTVMFRTWIHCADTQDPKLSHGGLMMLVELGIASTLCCLKLPEMN